VYVYIIGGALLSLGFRYVGTADQALRDIIIAEIQHLRSLKMQVRNSPQKIKDTNKNSIDKNALMSVISAAVLGLSMIMAGTGDIESLRVMKKVRKWIENEANYGYNMAVH